MHLSVGVWKVWGNMGESVLGCGGGEGRGEGKCGKSVERGGGNC